MPINVIVIGIRRHSVSGTSDVPKNVCATHVVPDASEPSSGNLDVTFIVVSSSKVIF